MPYIDHDMKVMGMTEPQVVEMLRREFTSILKEPQVTIFVEEYHARMASIAGAVNQPKQVALTRELRLYDLVSLAGGLTEKAGNIIQLIHTRPEDSYEVIDIRDLVRKSELLSSIKLRILLEELLEHFDHVFIDSPPVIHVTDALMISPFRSLHTARRRRAGIWLPGNEAWIRRENDTGARGRLMARSGDLFSPPLFRLRRV